MGVLDLLNEPLLLRLRIVTYGILIFFSFFIFIGAAVMKVCRMGYKKKRIIDPPTQKKLLLTIMIFVSTR